MLTMPSPWLRPALMLAGMSSSRDFDTRLMAKATLPEVF